MPRAPQHRAKLKNSQNKLGNSKIPLKRRAWGPKRRLNQAKLIRKTKPWHYSTGPKTPEGKTRTSANALKTSAHSASRKALSALLTRQSRYVRAVLKAYKTGHYPSALHDEGIDITIQLLRAVNTVNLSP